MEFPMFIILHSEDGYNPRINIKNIMSYCLNPPDNPGADGLDTYVSLTDSFGHWVKETPEEIDAKIKKMKGDDMDV